MTRKNRRIPHAELVIPDLTQPLPPAKQPDYRETTREQRERTARRHDELAQRQKAARINDGIDWNICLVPMCGTALHAHAETSTEHDHTQRLPLCLEHLAVAHAQSSRLNDPIMIGAVATFMERRQALANSTIEKDKREFMARTDGTIYFIRLNGLIKVGWSRAVGQRLASYGPQVEVLAVMPGTRADETNLHRHLRPARAIGREWYEDGPILADYVADVLKRHGPPPAFKSQMTKPKQVVAGKRHR